MTLSDLERRDAMGQVFQADLLSNAVPFDPERPNSQDNTRGGWSYLSGSATHFMDNSPTNQLADRPTRRQLNWSKNQLAEIEIVTKIDVRFFGHMDESFW